MSDTENQVEALRDGAEVARDATLELGAENQRLRERVAELEAHIRKGDEFIGAVERAEKAERERDEAQAKAERLHRSLVVLVGVEGAELPEKATVGVLGERNAARAEASMLRAALMDLCEAAEFLDGGRYGSELSDARGVLAASPGDWLAARDRALAERVREVVLGKPMNLPKDNAAWCTSCLENVQTAVEVRANALDLDALVGGKS